MNLPVEIIEKIVRACKNDARKIAEELKSIDDVREKIDRNKSVLAGMEKDYRRSMEGTKEFIRKVQKTCKYWWTTYHGDPAGGSDSTTICEICGWDERDEYRRTHGTGLERP